MLNMKLWYIVNLGIVSHIWSFVFSSPTKRRNELRASPAATSRYPLFESTFLSSLDAKKAVNYTDWRAKWKEEGKLRN